jgi:hypothetical protein
MLGLGKAVVGLVSASVELGLGVGAKTVEGISYVAGANVVVLRRVVGVKPCREAGTGSALFTSSGE